MFNYKQSLACTQKKTESETDCSPVTNPIFELNLLTDVKIFKQQHEEYLEQTKSFESERKVSTAKVSDQSELTKLKLFKVEEKPWSRAEVDWLMKVHIELITSYPGLFDVAEKFLFSNKFSRREPKAIKLKLKQMLQIKSWGKHISTNRKISGFVEQMVSYIEMIEANESSPNAFTQINNEFFSLPQESNNKRVKLHHQLNGNSKILTNQPVKIKLSVHWTKSEIQFLIQVYIEMISSFPQRREIAIRFCLLNTKNERRARGTEMKLKKILKINDWYSHLKLIRKVKIVVDEVVNLIIVRSKHKLDVHDS